MSMSQWMTPDFGRIMMLLGIGMFSISMFIGLLASRIRRSFKPFSKRAIWYLLISMLVMCVIALLAAIKPFNTYSGNYITSQFLMMAAGALHLYCMEKKLSWGNDHAFWPDFLYTFLLMLAGGICYALVYRLVNKEGLEFYMMSSAIFFMVPLFVIYTFRRAMAIPPKIFKLWFYPVHEPVEDPDEGKLKNMLLISFEFQKNGTDRYYTNFRTKAPVDMELGDLFYYFINDYNERHANSHINYVNQLGQPNGWMFYKKPKWYTIFTKYMDADKTIFINAIRENDVVVCARIR
jgi:Type VI secretion system, TssN